MLTKTNGISLRAIKYGDTSLITTIFTHTYGIQTYMVKGVRTSRTGKNRAAFFQPGTLLELVVYRQPQKSGIEHIREFQAAYIYTTLHEDVVRNSILLFSAEWLLKLLPEHAPLPHLYDFTYDYFVQLDKRPVQEVANFPLYFVIQCSRELGYEIKGNYCAETPHLNLQEGGFTEHPPVAAPYTSDEDAATLNKLLAANDHTMLARIEMNADQRLRLLDWYIAFMQQHTQHMGNIRSLSVLRAILH